MASTRFDFDGVNTEFVLEAVGGSFNVALLEKESVGTTDAVTVATLGERDAEGDGKGDKECETEKV